MSTAVSPDRTIRSKIEDVRNAMATKREERAAAVADRDKAKVAFAEAGLDVTLKETQDHQLFKDAQASVERVGELDDAIGDLQATERGLLAMLGGSDAPASASANGPEDQPSAKGVDLRALFANSPEFQRFISAGGPKSTGRVGELVVGQIGDARSAAGFLSPMAAVVHQDDMQGAMASDRRGIIMPNLRPLRLLDLFPFGTTDANMVEYVQVLTKPNAAAEWVEGEVKPEAGFTTEDANAPVATIPSWIKVRRSALADVGMLQSLLSTLLVHDVRRRLEDQIVSGNGTGVNITGILNMDGIAEPAPVVGDNTADAILRAITAIFLADGDPNFVALHPLTWQELLLMRENQAERTGAYLYGSPSMQVAPTIWGLAITQNRAVTADGPLVGDSMAASVLVKEGMTVRISDSDQDDFVRNRVTILVETRVAFPIWRPPSFAVAPVPGS